MDLEQTPISTPDEFCRSATTEIDYSCALKSKQWQTEIKYALDRFTLAEVGVDRETKNQSVLYELKPVNCIDFYHFL